MAYEISEAFYAGLSLVDTSTLNSATSNVTKFKELYNTALLNFGGKLVKDGASESTKKGMQNQIASMEANGKDEVLYSDLAAALSAVLGTRKRIKNQPPDAVFLTGNQWNTEVEKFKIKAFGMADYNSSDTIIRYGKEYIGISLKKKPTATAPSPTLINTAFSKFIKGNDLKTIETEINNHRIKFFATVIKNATQGNGPLSDLPKKIKDKVDRLNPNQLNHAKQLWNLKVEIEKNGKTEEVALINLKGASHLLDSETVDEPGNKDPFRKYVNQSLASQGKKVNPLFKGFIDIMNKPGIKDTIADSLLNKVLKLSLFDELDTWKTNEFGFYLVEGVGNVNPKLDPNVGQASVTNLHSVMVAIAMLSKLSPSLEIDFTKTGQRKAAKVFFILKRGNYSILDIELRYKGSFTAFPQFFATMTPTFKDLLKKDVLGIK